MRLPILRDGADAAPQDLEAGLISTRTTAALAASKQKLGCVCVGHRPLTAEMIALGRAKQSARAQQRAADIAFAIEGLRAEGMVSLHGLAKGLTAKGRPCRSAECSNGSAVMPDDLPRGQRFSHVYLPRGEPLADSPRMRRRLGELAQRTFVSGFSSYVTQELGVDVPSGWETANWVRFCERANIEDLLDTVTLYVRFCRQSHRSLPEPWLSEVARIFREENVRYQLDAFGGCSLPD